MAADTVQEIFIPPPPTPPLDPTQHDNEPPRLPWASHSFVPQNSMMAYDPTGGHNPYLVWPWPHLNPFYQHHPNFPPPPPPPPPPSMEINPQLSINLRDPENPHLAWDIVHLPQRYARIRDRTFFRRFVKPRLQEPAFRPDVQKIWISSTHPVLGYWVDRWGPMVILSDNITVGEVLNGIHEYLRAPLKQADLSKISSVPGNRQALRYARAQRARDSDGIEAAVIKQGYQRIDVLGGHRRFQGLQVLYGPDGTWKLHLFLLPGTLSKIY